MLVTGDNMALSTSTNCPIEGQPLSPRVQWQSLDNVIQVIVSPLLHMSFY